MSETVPTFPVPPVLPNYLPTEPVPGAGLRRFSDTALQSAITAALSEVPEGHMGAAVDLGYDEQKNIVAAFAVRLNAGWSVMGAGARSNTGDWSGKVGLRWSGR